MYRYNATETEIIREADGAVIPMDIGNYAYQAVEDWVAAGNAISPPAAPTTDQLKAAGAAAIQNLMDSTALAHGYDSLERCITYIGDAVPLWNSEGTRAKAWRSECWSKAKQIQDDATAGNWPTVGAGQVPTIADVLAAMPPANWPVA